ncbi:RHOMBOID-like 1 [Abeliophyllum distichum]|uniref:RHOMBOID-like protein n=1 Tax=Abeliophyllum distichum TaxID=126358 RepID=A0ABD1Q4Z8_9LAMI
MLSLLFVGIRLEQEFGFVRIGLLYVIAGIGGNLSSSLFLQALLTLLLIIIINLSVGILPHVDNFAHLGGFVTGFLLGFVLLIRPQYGWVSRRKVPAGYVAPSSKSKYKTYQYIMLAVALILLISGFTVGLVLLLGGVDGNDHCSWCHYMSCVPTRFWNCEARCSTSQEGNQVNMTCMQNHKSKLYILGNGNSTAQIQKLCIDLCS